MSDFEPSPRTSKRRKVATYGSNRSNATSPSLRSPSVLRGLSNAISGISRRLFEPQTKKATAAQAVDSDDSQDAGQTDGQRENHVVYDTGVGTELSVGRTTKPGRSTNGYARGVVSRRRSSARRTEAFEETIIPLDEASIAHRSTSSSIDQQVADHADVDGGVTNRRRVGLAPRVSLSDRPAALPKQRRSNTIASTPNEVTEEPATENDGEANGDTVVTNQRSSGRERRKPRRYSEDVEDMAEKHRQPLVGILTPTKRNRTGLRKSVAFENKEERLGEQLKFDDIEERRQATDNARRKTKASSSHLKVASESETSGPIEAVSVTQGDGLEEELAMEDTVVTDMDPMIDSPINANAVLDSLLEADGDSYLTMIKSKVISRLTGSSLVPLTNLVSEYTKVHSVLNATVTAGEGNSILILGARGSGKTNLIETALANISREHADDFHVVRLNGFQQTDDKIALREIWRQLGREMQVEEDEVNQVSSYADTMASLLHLLSHPEELAEVLEPNAPSTTTKSVIFILDEFDLFATHPRQTLLYNLFDIAQAKKAPIAVIGCSTRVDVAELLEKRVKSRFSHRWVHLAQPKSFQAFEAVVEAALSLETVEGDLTDNSESSWRDAWNTYMKVRVPPIGAHYFTNSNKSIFIPSAPIQALLRQAFYTTKSIPAVFSSLYIPVASITSLVHPSRVPISLAPLTPPDSPIHLLSSLSPLHLCLLISAARLDAIHNASIVNFNLVYQTYVELASRSRLQSSASGAFAQGGVTKIWGKEIAKGAWEELGNWEILVPAAPGRGKGDDAPETKMWKVDVTLEEIAACVGDGALGVSEVLAKWCKEA